MKNSRPAAIAAGLLFGSFLVANAASAHSVLVDPVPRSPSDAIKVSPPCGGVPRTDKFQTYKEGDTVTVKWRETVDHTGCFVVSLVEENDTKVTILKTLVDTAGDITTVDGGAPHEMAVQLPAGASCERCALQLRQVMSGTATCDSSTFTASTYLSCADIRITYADGGVPPALATPDGGTAADGGATAPTDDVDAASGGGDGTGTTTDGTGTSTNTRDAGKSSSGNGATLLDLPANDAGGCSTTNGPAPFGAGAGLVIGLGLALAARRKKS